MNGQRGWRFESRGLIGTIHSMLAMLSLTWKAYLERQERKKGHLKSSLSRDIKLS